MHNEMSDEMFREFCKLCEEYFDSDFLSPIPAPIPNHYEPLPHVPTSVPRPP